MKHKISILFHLNSSKASKKGLYPIYQRITINGARIELSASKFVEKSKWNASAGKIKGTNEEARLINSHLDILKSKVYETENWMINNNQEINAQTFKNKFLSVEKKQGQLILIFEDHNLRYSNKYFNMSKGEGFIGSRNEEKGNELGDDWPLIDNQYLLDTNAY